MRSKIEKLCEENDMNVLFADGFDEAIIGLGRCFSHYKVIYDKEMVINILTKDMTVEDAEEYFEFNIVGAYVGDETPVFLEKLDVL
jgi:hypothetical protein